MQDNNLKSSVLTIGHVLQNYKKKLSEMQLINLYLNVIFHKILNLNI